MGATFAVPSAMAPVSTETPWIQPLNQCHELFMHKALMDIEIASTVDMQEQLKQINQPDAKSKERKSRHVDSCYVSTQDMFDIARQYGQPVESVVNDWLTGLMSPAEFVAAIERCQSGVRSGDMQKLLLGACYVQSSLQRTRAIAFVPGLADESQSEQAAWYGMQARCGGISCDVGSLLLAVGACSCDISTVRGLANGRGLGALDNQLVEAYLLLLQNAVIDALQKTGMADFARDRESACMHVSPSVYGYFDDPLHTPDQYVFNRGFWQQPAIGLMHDTRHYWVVTNVGAAAKLRDDEKYDTCYKRAIKDGEPMLVAYNAKYGGDRCVFWNTTGSNGAAVECAVSPCLLPYIPIDCVIGSVAISPSRTVGGSVRSIRSASGFVDEKDKAILVQPPVIIAKQYGPPTIPNQQNARDCGAWACFFAFCMARALFRIQLERIRATEQMGAWDPRLPADMQERFHKDVVSAIGANNQKLREVVCMVDESSADIDPPPQRLFCCDEGTGRFGYLFTTRLRRAIVLSIMTQTLRSFDDLTPVEF